VDVRLAIGLFDFRQSDIAVRVAVGYSCDAEDVCLCNLFGDSEIGCKRSNQPMVILDRVYLLAKFCVVQIFIAIFVKSVIVVQQEYCHTLQLRVNYCLVQDVAVLFDFWKWE
jgi:hypothetical protein